MAFAHGDCAVTKKQAPMLVGGIVNSVAAATLEDGAVATKEFVAFITGHFGESPVNRDNVTARIDHHDAIMNDINNCFPIAV
jgi:hypothetical protein